jgi:ribosomal protein L11 methylase PrmA
MENNLPFSEMPPEEGMWDTGGLLSPYQPTLEENIISVLNKVNLDIDDVLIDLGCGDGRILFHAAFMQVKKAIGFELNQDLISEARVKIEDMGLEETIQVVCQDFLEADLSEATVIYMYLLPEALVKLKTKLVSCFAQKTRVIISHHFSIPWWQGEEFLNSHIYFRQ